MRRGIARIASSAALASPVIEATTVCPCQIAARDTAIKPMTPYAKLKSLPGAGARLTDGVTFAELDRTALAVSDLDAVRRVNDACRDLFRTIHRAPPRAA